MEQLGPLAGLQLWVGHQDPLARLAEAQGASSRSDVTVGADRSDAPPLLRQAGAPLDLFAVPTSKAWTRRRSCLKGVRLRWELIPRRGSGR